MKNFENNNNVWNDLIKLGDMIGAGLADEPDGKWIRREYRKTAKSLGIIPKRVTRVAAINSAVSELLENDSSCSECGGVKIQTRSGSLRLICKSCGVKYQLKVRKND